MKYLDRLIFITAFTLIVTTFIEVTTSTINVPDVYRKHLTGECVKVIDANGHTVINGCENLPTKYRLIVVD